MRWAICVLCAIGYVAPLSGQALAVEFAESVDASLTSDDRAYVTSIAEAAYREVLGFLPELGSVTLTVSFGQDVIPETGEVGAALAPGQVLWVVDPAHPGGVRGTAAARLRGTLFHELHHIARGYVMTGSASPITLLDSVVSEGLATAFARDSADDHAPWSDYPSSADDWARELLALSPGASYQEWMFDHPDGRRWIGYRAGTYVADQAMAASGLSAAELTGTSTDRVLRLAGLR